MTRAFVRKPFMSSSESPWVFGDAVAADRDWRTAPAWRYGRGVASLLISLTLSLAVVFAVEAIFRSSAADAVEFLTGRYRPGWTTAAIYMLAVTICIPAAAWLADRFGAKRVFVVSIVLYAFSSAACGFATTLTELVIADKRPLQNGDGTCQHTFYRFFRKRLCIF